MLANALFLVFLITLIAPSPVHAQYEINSRWGILGDMAEYDFEADHGVITVRWEVFNEVLVLTDWKLSGERSVSKFELKPSWIELAVNGPDSERIKLSNSKSGDLVMQSSGLPYLWRKSADHIVRNIHPDQSETIIPLGSSAIKVERVSKLIITGKVRAVTPNFRRSISGEVSTIPVESIPTNSHKASYPAKGNHASIENQTSQGYKKTEPTAAAGASLPNSNEPRIALVIGNSRYSSNLGALANPSYDARLIAGVLRALSFDVELMIDADQKTMKRAISNLGKRLERAGKGSTGLFYFAGHGMQSRGQNYLLPVGSEMEREADVDLEAVAADSVLSQMEEAGSAVNIVILDACRNTPMLRSVRSGLRGLARMSAPNGSFISYSTAPGSVAFDGDGRYSPFADALSKELREVGQPIEITFRNVRKSVLNMTNGLQTPWDASSLTDTFIFQQ